MKDKVIQFLLTVLVVLTIAPSPLLASRDKEKVMYLGVLNGQVQGNSVVKVTRTLPDPVLFRAEPTDTLPHSLIVRSAVGRPASGGTAWVTVKQVQPESGQEARITLKTLLMVDGQKVPLIFTPQGVDMVITLPTAEKNVELRTDSPAELEVPANYRGNVQLALQVEGEQTS
ncbi:minor fimbrial subunit faeF precursor [Erwinia amylovora Ea644]|uniref:DUF5462 family protein n=1 Tax=Erwinia amylovora TaxID=552 RepID=UPI0002CA4737|nr:DUF5462 family protein [Erwinia amylovora]CCP01353.1 minor fimbrial subunit faeF precursor [Erwinia amylovora Ea644]